MRVIRWIVDRVQARSNAVESPLGLMPKYDDIDWKGLDFTQKQFNNLMSVDQTQGLNEAVSQVEYFKQFKKHLPPEFTNEVSLLFMRLIRSNPKWTLPTEEKDKKENKKVKKQDIKAKTSTRKRTSKKTK